MNLIRDNWSKKEGKEFQDYLISLGNPEKKQWATNILNTNMEVLVIKTPDIKRITKQIQSGNSLSFLDLWLWDYYENSAICGNIISSIKDFEQVKKYLDIYSLKVDNWASCDLLSFNIKGHEQEYFDLAMSYLKDDYVFRRRIGFVILFNYINNDAYIDSLFDAMNMFYDEKEYYVNMINAWLFCECFIKRREKTIDFLNSHKLNKFTINKGISKCRDSYRVSAEDKDMLLKWRIK